MNTDKIFCDFLKHLKVAKEHLAHQKGQRCDPFASDYIPYDWNDFCEEIGISRQVADYWIKKFTSPEDFNGSVPPGFTAAVWFLNKAKKRKVAQ